MAELNNCSLLKKRIEQAKEKGCQDDSLLEGAICTNRCEFREICTVEKTSLLIQAQTNNIILKNEFERIAGLHCLLDILTGWQSDEYIIGGQERDI